MGQAELFNLLVGIIIIIIIIIIIWNDKALCK